MSKSALLCRYVHFHLINSQRKSFLFIFVHWFGHWLLYWFVHWFGQVNRQKATLKKNNLFFEKLCCYFIHIFPKSLCNFFTARYLDVRFWDLCILFVWSSIHCIGIFLFTGRKCVDLVVILKKGKEETFAISLQNRKRCFCLKYLTLFRPRKFIAVNFTFIFYSM